MKFTFTLGDLIAAYNQYCAGLVAHIENLNDTEKQENLVYMKAVQEFITDFTDDYIYDYLDEFELKSKKLLNSYKDKYFTKLYTVKVYGQEYDASTADPVILEKVSASDEHELKEKIRSIAWKEHGIYNMTSYEVLEVEEI